MTAFLRSVYQGAIAAGWEPMELTSIMGLPPQCLAFRRPGGKKGIVFARPEYGMTVNDMIATSQWCLPQGLRLVWFSEEMPTFHKPDAPFVQTAIEGYVQPPKSMSIMPVAEFVEMALLGWFRFSEEYKRWVWSNPATDPEAVEKRKFKDAASKREAQRAADLMRGR